MRWAGALIAGLVACAQPEPAVLVDARPATTYVIVELGSALGTARAFEVSGDLAPPIEMERTPGLDVWVLAYDRTIAELRLVPGPEGRLVTRPPDAPIEEAWPLPEPERWWSLGSDATALEVGVGKLEAVLASFRVERPPCAEKARLQQIPEVPDGGFVSAAIGVGSEVVFGMAAERDRPRPRGPQLFRASFDEGIEAELTGELADTATSTRMFAPLGFVDGGLGWVAWPARSDRPGFARIDLRSFDAAGAISPPLTTWIEDGPGALEELAGGTFDGQRTWMARDSAGELFVLDPDDTWRRVASLGADHRLCTSGINSLVLTVDGPGVGRVSGLGTGVLRYDLRSPDVVRSEPWFSMEPLCKSVTARTASGLEVVVYVRPGPLAGTSLSWRREGGAWSELQTTTTLSARSIIAIGDEVFLSASKESIVHFDDEPSRPEIPPRECGPVPATVSAHRLVDAGDRRLFVGGYGQRAAWLALAPRP